MFSGYAVEYAQGYYVTSRSEFVRVLVDGPTPKATIDRLQGDATYHVRVAPRFGSGIGRFSDPPDAFSTPPIPVAGRTFSAHPYYINNNCYYYTSYIFMR